MKDKVCMVTGASSGIGKATALGLARMEARVFMVCRSRERGEAAAEEVRQLSGNRRVDFLTADLSSQADVRRLAGTFKAGKRPLHVLINNAGLSLTRRQVTVDGLETVLAVNYLAPFLLTSLLLDTLKASAPARVINVAGDWHRKASIDFDDLMSERSYNGLRANNRAKLALIVFTYELAKRLEGSGVTVNCLHPGAVATDAPAKDPHVSALSRFLYRLVKPFFLSPEKGAETTIHLASSPEVEGVSGKYFIKKAAVRSSEESYRRDVAARLWETSSRLTGLAPRTGR